MQIALKALQDFDKADISKLALETTRLQLAGIGSFAADNPQQCMNVDSPSLVDTIAEKVIEKMKISSVSFPGGEDGGNNETGNATYSGYRPFQNKRNTKASRGAEDSFQGTQVTVVMATELNNLENAVRVKAPSIYSVIVPPDFVKPVGIEATMHGIMLAQITND